MAGRSYVRFRSEVSGGRGVLDERWVRRHLIARGLITSEVLIAVTPLAGGVSSDIVAVSGPALDLVVKRALPQLRVEQEWLADARRLITEGRALRLAHQLVPGGVPAVLDLDENTLTLVLERAPRDWRNWRDDLLTGAIEPSIGKRLGETIAIWHRETARPRASLSDFDNVDAFVQLRINPFFRTVAEQHPVVAGRIEYTAERLLATKTCLVHGDFSPKNVLTNRDSQWVLDWEVAHLGDPVFDIAYLLSHLVLKAMHRRRWARSFYAVAGAFLDAYRRAEPSVPLAAGDLAETVACLLLARVDGKSPAEYLSIAEQARVRALALEALSGSPRDVLGIWVQA
jgi:tRNA A-37 threonylcarbamoyl transferase component Bud32